MTPDPNPVPILMAIFIPAAIVGVILGSFAIFAYMRVTLRSRELAADLIMQMLGRKHTVEEIERVLLAWSQDADLAKSMAKARKQLAATKPEPHFA